MKKSAYRRTLDNITTVIIAFDGLAKLFEPADDKMSTSELPRLDSQGLSSSNNKSFSEARSTIVKNDSAKSFGENKLQRNRMSEDRQFSKVSTLTDTRLKPIKKLNHSIKEPHLPIMSKTPGKNLSEKIENLSTKVGSQIYTNLSESMKEQKPTIINKPEASRNHTIFTPSLEEQRPIVSKV